MPRDRGACVEVESGCVSPVDDANNALVMHGTSPGEKDHVFSTYI